jgi:hypothetical protein
VRSEERIYILNSIIRDIGGVLSLSSAQVGNNAEFTINLTAQSQTVTAPFAIHYELTGTVITDNAYDTPTLSNGATFEDNGYIQIPQGLSSVKVTVPLINAAGKTITFATGFFDNNDTTSTTINVAAAGDYLDLIGVLSGPSVAPTSTGGDPNQLNATFPQRYWYFDLRASIPQPNKAGNPRYVSTWADGVEKTFEFEAKADRATNSIDYQYQCFFVAISGGAETALAVGTATKTQGNGAYTTKTTVRFTNNTGAALNTATHEVVMRVSDIGDSFGSSADPHVYSIRNFDEV